ncbi:MAG: ABC transporter permease [Dethiosulfovibrio peptidovorans]|nr:MAG: ABC transporter permease [Dethiosulfovibrio peptidovorans]
MTDGKSSASILIWLVLTALTIGTFVVSIGVGRYFVPPDRVLGILASLIVPVEPFWTPKEEAIVMLIRFPRIVAALITGAGLSVAGAALQGMFKNPLVGPQIIGVSTGAGFGGALAIMASWGGLSIISSAFAFGIVAIVLVWSICGRMGRGSLLPLILAGVVVGAFFTSLTSLLKFVADPYDKLPAIVMWLMGSFATVTYKSLATSIPALIVAGTGLYAVRFRINILSLGEEEAESLGMNPRRTRWFVVACVTLISSATVALAGIVGWVGLVIPHVARAIVGANHRRLLPASALIGGAYLVGMDDLARCATTMEIPLGVITALIGAPFFAVLLIRGRVREGGGR